jgi:hypothetical protein
MRGVQVVLGLLPAAQFMHTIMKIELTPWWRFGVALFAAPALVYVGGFLAWILLPKEACLYEDSIPTMDLRR